MSKNNKTGFKAQKEAAQETPSFIVQNLTVRPAARDSQDISKWRTALKSAEATNPRRTLLYDLYDDIMLDGRLSSVVEKRIMAITNADWEFVKDGKVIPLINDLIDTPAFEDLLKELMLTRFWGYSVLELQFQKDGFSCYSIPRKHLRPEKGLIAKDQSGEGDINIREGIYLNNILEAGKEKDLGILLRAAQYVIYKRGGFGDWAQFAELFGMPFRKGTYNGFDDSQRQELENSLEQMGGAAYVVLPDGSNVEFIENKTNSDGSLYDKLRNACNEEIAVLILGQSLTTGQGSNRSLGEVHKEVEESINKADRRWARRWLNTRFTKCLEANGHATQGGYFQIKGEDEEKISKKDKLDMQLKLVKDLDLPYDPDHFYEEYGLPKPADYDKQMAEKTAHTPQASEGDDVQKPASTPQASGNKNDKKPKVQKNNDNTNLYALDEDLNTKPLSWFVKLANSFGFFVDAPAQTGATMTACCGSHHTAIDTITLAAIDGFDTDSLIKRAWEAGGSMGFDTDLFNHTASTLCDGFLKGWRSRPTELVNIGIDYGFDDPSMLTAFETNLFRFAGVKTLYEAQQLNTLFRKSKSFEDFYHEASQLVKVHNKDWLRTEYDTAYAVGESTATYNRLMKQRTLFPYWQYKTVKDNRVRETHRWLHDAVFHVDHKAWQTIYPPNGWNCRCYVVPRTETEVTPELLKNSKQQLADYEASQDWDKTKKSGFGINRAKLGAVFTENQQYINSMEEGNKLLSELRPSDFGLPNVEQQLEAKAKAEIDKASVDTDAYYKKRLVDGVFQVKDYAGRILTMNEKDYANHTTNEVKKRQYRIDYLNELETILSTPDEVWFNAERKQDSLNQLMYIKYYKDKPLVAVGAITPNGDFKLKTWYDLAHAEIRWGLLVRSSN
ncbi:phage portal protein family protein [Solitalea koreensis]|uniref:Phage putative head morphogenesis protein, SPP1 gp7 family n=1 Tax=Solitalea koreensis TaxID=543615 RepID=A0A521BM57_9SPHI|nr:DUF935 family protein [Solitalea koreensis]SMO48196.1 phage putative head morphogenesis protein, SPP1 gp7 family [Solitalea koreensis]